MIVLKLKINFFSKKSFPLKSFSKKKFKKNNQKNFFLTQERMKFYSPLHIEIKAIDYKLEGYSQVERIESALSFFKVTDNFQEFNKRSPINQLSFGNNIVRTECSNGHQSFFLKKNEFTEDEKRDCLKKSCFCGKKIEKGYFTPKIIEDRFPVEYQWEMDHYFSKKKSI